MGDERTIRIAQSCAQDPAAAVEALHDGLAQPDISLVLFFCSSEYDHEALAAEMARRFAGVPVVGCTTAGEIGPLGCRDHSIAGVSFAAAVCTAVSRPSRGPPRLPDRGRRRARAATCAAGSTSARRRRRRANTFAFLLVDGLSGHEEQVAHSLQQGLGEIPLVGGSAGDSLSFERTYIYCGRPLHVGRGRPRAGHHPAAVHGVQDAALRAHRRAARGHRGRPRRARGRGDQRPAGRAGVRAHPRPRRRAISTPSHFAASPVVVLIDGANYVRSIQKAEPDGSLKFYCAIERGVVLRVARGVDLVGNLESALLAGARPDRAAAARAHLRLHPAQAGDRRERARARP